MIQGDFRQKTLEAGTVIGTRAALTLIVIDEQHAFARPAQGLRQVAQGVLPSPRFAVLLDLVRRGLPHVNNRDFVEMLRANLGTGAQSNRTGVGNDVACRCWCLSSSHAAPPSLVEAPELA